MADAAEGTAGHYRTRLEAMEKRLAGSIDAEQEAAVDAAEGTEGDGVLHTHNADMDTEGLDAAVGRSAALSNERRDVAAALRDLSGKPDDEEIGETDRARFDSLLGAQDFAEKMDRKYGVSDD